MRHTLMALYRPVCIDYGISPRDHAILESAYQKNSKPDKEERLNLVRQVNLGEKEVQVSLCGSSICKSTFLLTEDRYGSRTVDKMIVGSLNRCNLTS